MPSFIVCAIKEMVLAQSLSTFKTCGSGNSDLSRVISSSITPNPPSMGNLHQIMMDVDLKIPIMGTGTVIESKLFYNGKLVMGKSRDFCAQFACPMRAGVIRLEGKMFLPLNLPKGRYVIQTQVIKPPGLQMFCIENNLNI